MSLRTVVVLLALAIGALAMRNRVSHSSQSFEATLATARTAGVTLVLEFSMTGCGACRAFERMTLAKPIVQDALKQVQFVEYNVSESAAAHALAERFNVRVYPTVIAVDAEGREHARSEGPPAKTVSSQRVDPRPLTDVPT